MLLLLQKRPNFLTFWIYLQIISIIDQSFAIVMNLLNSDLKFFKKSDWSMPLSSSYLCKYKLKGLVKTYLNLPSKRLVKK